MDVVQQRLHIAKLRRFARRIPMVWSIYWGYWKIRAWLEAKGSYQLSRELVDFGGYAEPNLDKPVSQLCTASQFFNPHYKYWCKEMGSPPRFARKQWEFVYITQVLNY